MANTTTTPKGKEENRSNPTLEKAKDAAFQTADKAKDVAYQAADKAKDVAYQAADKVKEGAAEVGHMASQAASSVGHMASEAASNVGKSADHLTSTAGSTLRNFGETLSQQAPREGMLGNASQAVANTIKDSGRYLEESGLSGVAEDLTTLIRRNPVPAILIGIGVGFLIGRALRS